MGLRSFLTAFLSFRKFKYKKWILSNDMVDICILNQIVHCRLLGADWDIVFSNCTCS